MKKEDLERHTAAVVDSFNNQDDKAKEALAKAAIVEVGSAFIVKLFGALDALERIANVLEEKNK